MYFDRITKETWRRIGKFSVCDSERTTDRLYTLFGMMQNFVVLRADYDFSSQSIEYTAISPFFDVLPEGQRAPRYEVFVTYLPNDRQTIHVERRRNEET
jgi:hypothetical protein